MAVKHIEQVLLEDFGLDLETRKPEEEGVGVVGRQSLPEGETGDRGTASVENLEATLAMDVEDADDDDDGNESSSF